MIRRPDVLLAALLAAQACPLLGAERDPFLPVAEPCATPLRYARYQGAVINARHSIALITFEPGQWQRWHLRESPASGWQVSDISLRIVTLTGPAGCPPLRLRLARQGVENENRADNKSATAEPAVKGGNRG